MIIDHPIVRHLWPLELSALPEDRIEAAARAYEDGTDSTLGRPLSEDERVRIAKWLVEEEWNSPVAADGYSYALLSRRFGINFAVIHPTLAGKASKLGQRYCHDCIPAPAGPGKISFPIAVKPFSAQSTDARRLRDTKAAVSRYLKGRETFDLSSWWSYEVCISIVAVVPASSRRMDVDNMAKGILDAMEGTLYENDRSVQHLDIRRIEHDDVLSYYSVTAQPVMDPRSDVLDRRFEITLASDPIVIE